MAASGLPPMAAPARSFADLISATPQPLPEMEVSFRQPKIIDGELVFSFSTEEIAKLAQPFRYSIVLKFIRQRPSLDAVRSFIRTRWGLSSMPMVSAMQRPRNVFVRMANEMDFNKALSRESCEVNGVFYRPFAWTPEFDENHEPPCVPVWVFLPGLPPNFFQPSVLKMLTAPIGRLIRCDNSTICATRTDGARVCVEVDSSKTPISSFWIGKPGVPKSRRQEIVYETLPAYCSLCKCQGHNSRTCRKGDDKKKTAKSELKWVKQVSKPSEERVDMAEAKNSVQQEIVNEKQEDVVQLLDEEGAEKLVECNEAVAEKNHSEEELGLGLAVNSLGLREVIPQNHPSALDKGEPNSFNGPMGNNRQSELAIVPCVVHLGLEASGHKGPKVPSLVMVTDLDVDGASLDEELNLLASEGDVAAVSSQGCEVAGENVQADEIHSDYEGERDNLKEDSRKDYCTDSEGTTKFVGSNQFVSVKVEEKGFAFILTIVYAKCNPVERKKLWEDLIALRNGNLPCADDVVQRTKRLGSELGKVLPRTTSDHSPLVIQTGDDPFRYGPRPFRFQFMWTDHVDFLSFVKGIWNQPGVGYGLLKLSFKLKRLKVALREWNLRIFGRTNVIIHELEIRIESLENSLQNSFSSADDHDLMDANLELSTWKGREDTRLSHMTKKSWLQDGDQNSKFFHAYLNAKNSKRINDMHLPDGTFLNNPLDIHKAAVVYFQQFLSESSDCDCPILGDLISPVISEEDNLMLCRTPSFDDIKEALFSIPIDSSPGPDGFSSGFFRCCWDIIKEDLMEAVSEFFQKHLLPRYYTASFIVLIPKVDSPNGFDKFRPISLCSVVYKICAKIIVGRLTKLLSKMISNEQGAFIPGRSIFENISITQEMVHSINKKTNGGNVLVKLDMSKAYDRVNWNSLIHVLVAFGFSPQFCALIKLCISSPWYSIMMNGTSMGFFKGERGLRQGDPLSPYLFVIMQEVLSRMLKKAFDIGKIGRFTQARGLMEVLHLYELWTGQILNKSKSAIFFSNKIPAHRKSSLLHLTGFSEGSFPFKYLGVPIVVGRLKVCDFGELIGKVSKKIAGWKMKLLSAGGRVILLRHVLSSMATHLLAVLPVPNGVFKVLNRIMSSFFWGNSDGRGKRKWVAWKNICYPTEEGGLGIRDFGDVQRALHMKFAWHLLRGQSLWADFFKGKYVKGIHLSLLSPNKGTLFWKAIVRCIPEVLNQSKWLVKEGNVSFWHDNWLDGGPISALYPVIERPSLKIKDCRIDNGWDIPLLERAVGQQKALELYHFLATRKDGQDVLIWVNDKNGNFSTKSAWDCIRVRAPSLPWAHWIWHPNLPKKISVMMWKALHNCLSVDDKIKNIGIPFVSKCNCCARGHMEDLNHVLCNGDFARQIWRLAANQLGVHMGVFLTWKEQINFWFRRAGKSSQLKIIFGILPSIVSWKIWDRRCKARFEDRVDSVQTVWHVIKIWIRQIISLVMRVSRISSHDVAILQRLDIPVLPQKPKQVRVVRWFRPSQGWMKLNSDGSSLGNPGPAGAGGVIRDSFGNLQAAYSVFLGQGSNNFAELRSLLEGVRRCYQLGFRRVDIEVDSQLIVSWVTKGTCNIWYLEDFWEELQGLLGCLEYRLTHVFREGNAVADYLAKRGAEGLNCDWSFNDALPSQLRGLLRLDKIGIPYLRIS
ncbi:uncharacterized protein LOC118344586 [Juglans regia]|uniref:Uncharacterized protein LOC118344586 n=1 Tax=Juglans regia TaxID=51240 RepID=A0A6P9EFB8_JUGRE|nr:uncharacterized protein LOC118344586 [Juglans regia]